MRLGSADLTAGVITSLYSPGANVQTTLKIVFANRGLASALVRVALTPDSSSPSAEHYLAYDERLGPSQPQLGDIATLSSIVFHMEGTETLWVRSNAASVTAYANGIERAVVAA